MKKILILSLILCAGAYAEPWGHRYPDATDGQPWNATNVAENSTIRMSYEWNQGDWDAFGSQVGVGTNMTGEGWTWTDIPWFQDDGGNKRVRTDVTFTIQGTNYYAYRFKKASINNGEYRYGSGTETWTDLAGNTDVASVANESDYVFVVPEGGVVFSALAILGVFLRR